MSHPGLADGPIYLDYNATTPVDPRVVTGGSSCRPARCRIEGSADRLCW